MEDIGDIYYIEVPENPYKEAAVETEKVIVEEAKEPAAGTILMIAQESLKDIETELVIENISSIDMEPVDELILEQNSLKQGENDIVLEIDNAIVDMLKSTVEEIMELPKTLGEYQRLLLQEKVNVFRLKDLLMI